MTTPDKPDSDDRDLRDLGEDFRRRQWNRRPPQRMGDVLSGLLAQKGYAQVQAQVLSYEAWQTAAGERLARDSRAGNVRRGILEVLVRNSAVLQELTFQKKKLLQQLQRLVPDHKIRDLRFRVGSLD